MRIKGGIVKLNGGRAGKKAGSASGRGAKEENYCKGVEVAA
jgi:hypothetical protein